jgi:glycosyltransferase involved in cell wall biosynthesis
MAINRRVYHLFTADGTSLEIVAPKQLNFPAGKKNAEAPAAGDPPIHFLELDGDNPRTYWFTGLEEILKSKQPRVVILDNDPVSSMAIKIGKWCRANNARLFCISCENLSLGILPTLKRRGIKALPAAIAKRFLLMRSRKTTGGIFCINTDGQKIFQAEGFRNVHHMPLGFDPYYFQVSDAERQQVRQQHKVEHKMIAYFGRLIPEKGVHLLIEALGQLKQYQWQLMMDDFDEYASDYNRRVRQLIESAAILDRVLFVNPSHTEIAAYMNAADIVCVPSVSAPNWKEQYGRVAAEAMACGCTVVASNSGALPELLGQWGCLFPEGDGAALRGLLEKLFTGAMPLKDRRQVSADAIDRLSIHRQKKVMQALLEVPGVV